MKKTFMSFTALVGTLMCESAFATAPECDTVDATQKCTDMGYVQTVSECSCLDGNSYPMLKCPFDDSKVYCYRSKSKQCEEGDILFSDKRCYYSFDLLPCYIEPVAVVFDAKNHLAVELDGGSMVPAVRNMQQSVLQGISSDNSPKEVKHPYKLASSDLYQKSTNTYNISKFPGIAPKRDASGNIQSFALMSENVEMSIPTSALVAFNNTTESIGVPAPNVTTLIDYDSCECSYNEGEFNSGSDNLKYKKTNLSDFDSIVQEKLYEMKGLNGGSGPAWLSAGTGGSIGTVVKPFDGFSTNDFKVVTTAFDPYKDASGTSNLMRYENYKLGDENFKLLDGDCAAIERCKNAALNYRSTNKTTGGYADTKKLYEWAKSNQNKDIDTRPATQEELSAAMCSNRGAMACTGNVITRGPLVETAAATRCMMMNNILNPRTLNSYESRYDTTKCNTGPTGTCNQGNVMGGGEGGGHPIAVVTSKWGYGAYGDPAGNYWFLPSIGDLDVLGQNIHKVNAGLAAAALYIAKYNSDPAHNKIEATVKLIGINSPSEMNNLLTPNLTVLKEQLKSTGAKTKAALSIENMQYLSAASSLLSVRLLYGTDDLQNGSAMVAEANGSRAKFAEIKDDLASWIGTDKQVSRLQLIGNSTAAAQSFFNNESLWASTMGYVIDDYEGPDIDSTATIGKKGIKNYDYTWFYRPLPRTNEPKFGVAQSWQTGDENRPRNVRCVYYFGADNQNWSADSPYNDGSGGNQGSEAPISGPTMP